MTNTPEMNKEYYNKMQLFDIYQLLVARIQSKVAKFKSLGCTVKIMREHQAHGVEDIYYSMAGIAVELMIVKPIVEELHPEFTELMDALITLYPPRN